MLLKAHPFDDAALLHLLLFLSLAGWLASPVTHGGLRRSKMMDS